MNEIDVANERWNDLPANVKHKHCMCPIPNKRLYSNMFGFVSLSPTKVSKEIYIMGRTPLAFFCDNCKLCLKEYLSYVTQKCEECERFYVPLIRKGTYPIKSFLCERCNIPSRAEVKRARFNSNELR